MEKPGKKLKKLIVIAGTTGAVYAGIKYLLPLVAPFFAGYVLALLLRPSARFLSYRLRITFGGRTRRAPIGLVGGVECLAVVTVLALALYRGAVKLWYEGKMLTAQFPLWLAAFDGWLTGGCHRLEGALGLREGSVADLVGELLLRLGEAARRAAMPFLMTNSMALLNLFIRVSVVSLVAFMAAMLSLQEMEDLKERRDRCLFRRELRLIGDRLLQTGRAWFKSQGMILILTTALCTAGMYLIGNPYYIMVGIAIGLLDALPLFGTGAVLIPWALAALVGGELKRAVILFGLYLVCYFLREWMETRLMGGQVGLSPLETLAAVYVGLELFGFAGFILGPLGLLLIEDLVEAWEGEEAGPPAWAKQKRGIKGKKA